MKKTANHSQFYALFAQMPGADKEQLIWEASNMLTTSLTDFLDKNPSGYKAMIAAMHRAVANMHKPDNADIKIYRSALLKRLQKYGIDTTDWNKVNGFLRQPRVAGKVMYDLSIDEIKSLIPKLEAINAKRKSEQAEVERMKQMN